MSKRVCAEPGCPTLVEQGARGGRCEQHRRAKDKARGKTTERGYGIRHQRLRARYQRRMWAGEDFKCWRCGTPIDPECWDLGHLDDRSGYAGPECMTCNRATAGR